MSTPVSRLAVMKTALNVESTETRLLRLLAGGRLVPVSLGGPVLAVGWNRSSRTPSGDAFAADERLGPFSEMP
jgi:hypothetical protein